MKQKGRRKLLRRVGIFLNIKKSGRSIQINVQITTIYSASDQLNMCSAFFTLDQCEKKGDIRKLNRDPTKQSKRTSIQKTKWIRILLDTKNSAH
jgi:hypothetical protein